MATNTTKLGLIKPDLTDVVDVGNLNDNADDIDAAVGFAIVTSGTRPGSPWSGQVIYETDTGLSLVWDGSAWQPAGGGGGGVTVSSTAPVSPSAGDLWWDSDDGEMYLYYDDGTSSQWVAAAGPSVAVQSTAPTGYEGQLWLDDTDGSMYVYYTDPGGGSSSWIGAVSRSGGILQVVSTTKTDTYATGSVAAGAFDIQDVPGLSVSITPTSTSSKILVSGTISIFGDTRPNFKVRRDGADITGAIGDADGSRARLTSGQFAGQNEQAAATSFQFLDTPSTTSTISYGVMLHNGMSVAKTLYVNRGVSATDNSQIGRYISSITVMEVAG